MDEVIEKAIAKIKTEMKKNGYAKVIGEHLLKHIEVNKETAKEIVEGKKSLMGSLGEMRKAAEKVKEGNVAVLTDEEGFKIVDKYFNLVGTQEEISVKEAPRVEEVKKKKRLDLSLDSIGL